MKIVISLFTCLFLGLQLIYAQNNVVASVPTIAKKKQVLIQVINYNGGLFSSKDSVNGNILKGAYYNGLDIRVGIRSQKDGLYQKLYRKPIFGLGVYGATFNTKAIGQPNAFYGFMEIPFQTPNRRWEWSYSIALGLSYNFKAFDKEANPFNIYLGTRKNVYINLQGQGNYFLSPRMDIGVGLGFQHFSNGAFRLPNKGLNMTPLIVSARYHFQKRDLPKSVIKITPPEYEPTYILDIYSGNGAKGYERAGRNYFKSTLGIVALKQFSYKYRIGLGVDLFYSDKGTDRIIGNQSAFQKNFSSGAFAAWEWVLTENLYMPINLGIYFSRNQENDESTFFYERIGLRYRFKNHLIAGISLKAHGGAADFVEWTIGYSFNKRKTK